MKTIQVMFKVEVPEDVDKEDILEWLRFELNTGAGMDPDNPLAMKELEAVYSSVGFVG